ncbi:MAG: transcriptional regulator [Bacteroidetes bacterium 43-93]|nr:Rrf2 family transcriptional regulator [Bacteroidota bacterium]OJW97861.1 MAG: transcriptional regulator [Bacteroidetes bacterium 43-93]
MFSKSCEYGIRAVIYIVSASKNGERVGIGEICQNIDAPEHFTAKILQILTRNRIVSSQKGVHGGFYLDDYQKGLALIEVVTAIDGKTLFTGCGLGLKQCSETNPCPIHSKFKSIRNDIKKMLEQTTIEELGNSIKKGKSVLKTLKI